MWQATAGFRSWLEAWQVLAGHNQPVAATQICFPSERRGLEAEKEGESKQMMDAGGVEGGGGEF